MLVQFFSYDHLAKLIAHQADIEGNGKGEFHDNTNNPSKGVTLSKERV